MHRSIQNFNIRPPGIPRAFDYIPCLRRREFDSKGLPGGGEFDLWLGRVGTLN